MLESKLVVGTAYNIRQNDTGWVNGTYLRKEEIRVIDASHPKVWEFYVFSVDGEEVNFTDTAILVRVKPL